MVETLRSLCRATFVTYHGRFDDQKNANELVRLNCPRLEDLEVVHIYTI